MRAVSGCSWAPKLTRNCEIKHWLPVARTDGRSVYGHVITAFSRMGRLSLAMGSRVERGA